MHFALKRLVLAAALIALPASAQAALSVVNVGAPAINCVFNVTCIVTVNDSIGNFTPPGDSGNARLQSRTYPGTAPAPAAGKRAYVYRVDMTAVKGLTAESCVASLRIKFGPIVQEPYKPGQKNDMFVVTSGGLGSVGVASATAVGGTLTVNFAAGGVCPGQTSYFFGLTSATTVPVASTATLIYSPSGSGSTAVRVP
jgi:hypothetical protein